MCKEWKHFIKDYVWGTAGGRNRLNRRLVYRWRNTAGRLKMVGTLGQEKVVGLFSNDTHVFCGIDSRLEIGLLAVYSLETGAWIRDLDPNPSEEMPPGTVPIYPRVAGGKGLVAAFPMDGKVVTLWSSEGEMDQLYSLNIQNHDTSLSITDIKVSDGRKVVIWASGDRCGSYDASRRVFLVALQMSVDGTWNQTILCDFLPAVPFHELASDTNWVALVESDRKVNLWRWDGREQKSIILPESLGIRLNCVALKAPFIILGLHERGEEASINVYKLESEGACLIKKIPISTMFGGLSTCNMKRCWKRWVDPADVSAERSAR